MPDTIFLLDNNGQLNELNEAGYLTEEVLQKLLADYPALISGSLIDDSNPRRWLLISREYVVPDNEVSGGRWSLDHLFIDQDCIPTLIEVKRSTDTRIRREVVGQILDYAANAVSYWSIAEMQRIFEAQFAETEKNPVTVLEEFLNNELGFEAAWQKINDNLKIGKIRLLIIADSIPYELKRIIEFLNGQMSPAEILGIEIKQFVGSDNIKTLVPKLVGRTAQAEQVKKINSSASVRWTWEGFVKDLEHKRGEKQTALVKDIYDWFRSDSQEIWFGFGTTKGSWWPKYIINGKEIYPISFMSDGKFEFKLNYLKNVEPFNKEAARLELVEKIKGFADAGRTDFNVNGKPKFDIDILINSNNYKLLFEITEWIKSQVKSNHQ